MPYYLQRIAMRQPANCFTSLRKVAVAPSIEPASRQIMASLVRSYVLIPRRLIISSSCLIERKLWVLRKPRKTLVTD
jgi:hypothetical protein